MKWPFRIQKLMKYFENDQKGKGKTASLIFVFYLLKEINFNDRALHKIIKDPPNNLFFMLQKKNYDWKVRNENSKF